MKAIQDTHAIGILLLLIMGCSTLRQKDNMEKSTMRYNEEETVLRNTRLSFTVDSVFQQGWFFSDTAFSYHPDSGLKALSGGLWIQNGRLLYQGARQSVDSSSHRRYGEQRGEKRSRTVRYRRYRIWLIAGGGVLLIVVFCVRRMVSRGG